MNNKRKAGQIAIRIILCPFVFVWGLLLLSAASFLPLMVLVFVSFLGIITTPIIYLLRKSGADIRGIEPLIDDTGSDFIGHFLGLTIHVWGAFAVVYLYLRDGKIFTGGI